MERCSCGDSSCPTCAPDTEPPEFPRDSPLPPDLVDTVPPSEGESDLEAGKSLGPDELPPGFESWKREQLLVLMLRKQAQGNGVLMGLDARTTRHADWQAEHDSHTKSQDDAISRMQRDRMWGTSIPLIVSLIAMLCAMFALTVAGVQGWYVLTLIGR